MHVSCEAEEEEGEFGGNLDFLGQKNGIILELLSLRNAPKCD
jgi:hypothetical protein